ncbi:MAG: hypothetical protein JSS62_05830 [Verrucomicrobia bacterium]|nr:hypothetical protein [Verrucomicrobiota bacterium]MBS0647131.1 hypothetical protein [Verrucomicrobiota bacterium]
MLRFVFYLFLIAGCVGGGWYVWDRFPFLHQLVEEKIHARECRTLEIRYSADDIMNRHRRELIKGSDYTFLEPRLLFYPYIMMHTKFTTNNSSTQEGIVLWGLTDGEMVLDTATWERTHGFEDCLISKANESDFKILKAVMEAGGALDRDRLYQKFKEDGQVVDHWINQCRDKKLIVSTGNRVRLHLQNPKMDNLPLTLIHDPLVAKPTKECYRSNKHYSEQQICKLAEMAFGTDFAIRRVEQIYLPVYSVGVQNPDGSILTTYWNALNGKRFDVMGAAP